MKRRFRKRNVISTIAKSSIGKRITSVALAATILVTGVPFTSFEGLIDFSTISSNAANADNNSTVYDDILDKGWYSTSTQTATINNPENFVKYTQAYHSHPENHYQDTIVFAVQGTMPEMSDFLGLGTSRYPFEGTIKLYSGSGNLFLIPEAFFDHISDKAVIVNESGTPVTLRIARTGGNGSGEPIFAKHIHHYSSSNNGTTVDGAASWTVELCVYEETIQNETLSRNYDFAGFIGEMQTGAVVQIGVTDRTSGSVYANSVTKDVGYICGKMGENNQLSVNSCTGDNTGYNITASDKDGNAGGVVGAMDAGAKLLLKCNMRNTSPVITSGSDGFAGGLVGKNDGGTVGFEQSSSTFYLAKAEEETTISEMKETEAAPTEAFTSGEVIEATNISESYSDNTSVTENMTENDTLPEKIIPSDPISETSLIESVFVESAISDTSMDEKTSSESNAIETDATSPSTSVEETQIITTFETDAEETISTETTVPITTTSAMNITLSEKKTILAEAASSPFSVGGEVVGGKGSGGLFGYFSPVFTANAYTYDIKDFTINVKVNGNGSIGGLFGILEIKDSSSTFTVKSTGTNKTVSAEHETGAIDNLGGCVGLYKAPQTSELIIDGITANVVRTDGDYSCSYGGVIGKIGTTTYVKFNNFKLSGATSPSGKVIFGGLVGDAGNAFVDVTGTATIKSASFCGGGLVGKFEDGVLRLGGVTDISGTTCAGGGQIVGERDDTLIFAENGWSIIRKSSPDEYDDIGSWGEVLRFHNSTISNGENDTSPVFLQSSVLTVNETSHNIAINEASTTINSVEDFAKAAICFSIDVGETGNGKTRDGNPWLSYVDTDGNGNSLDHTAIVTENLALGTNNIDLRHTGLTGLTRDNGNTKVNYSGDFDGNGKSIILAIGDQSINGNIYRHNKNGLFGILGRTITSGEGESATTSIEGGTIEKLSLAGTVNVKAHSDMCVGAAAALVLGDFSATDVNVSTVFNAEGSSNIILGRLAGSVTANGTSTTNFSITNTSGYGDYTGNISGANSGASSCYGGVIGKISSTANSAKTWTISNINLTTVANDSDHAGEIKNTSSKENQQIGGLVAVISNSNANKVTLTLADIDLDGVNLNEAATKTAGGLLGYKWTNTNVNVNSVTVTDGTITLSGSGADLGGIIYNASGKWTIPAYGLNMDGAVIDAQNAGSFGMIVNHGGSLYLLLTATDSFDCDDANLDDLKDGIVFDELVAYSVNYGTGSGGEKLYADEDGDPYILKNGNGIVSIKTSNLNMSGSGASGTYQPQTSRGTYLNKWTRYYYNLDTVTGAESPNAPQKLMLWGLNKYAHKDLKTFFPASNTFIATQQISNTQRKI